MPFATKSFSSCLLEKVKVNCDVVLWNNGGEVNLLKSYFENSHSPNLKFYLLQSPRNIGFAPGVNQAALWNREKSYEGLLLLNSDAILFDEFTDEHLKKLLDLNGIAGLKVFNDLHRHHRQKSARSFPSLMTAFASRQSVLAKIFPNNPWTQKYLGAELTENETTTVDWVSGCALFCPRLIWEKLKAFDEAYFFGIEDVDLARKAKELRVPVYFYPPLSVLHIGARASHRRAWKSDFYHHLGMWNYFIKWSNPFKLILGPFIFLGILLRFFSRRFVQIKTEF